MQNHFKTKEKHKEAKDKTSPGQDVDKTGRTTKKRGKEGGERGRSGQSYSERTWGEQGNILAQAQKKGRRMEREKRKAQIENGDE